MRELSQRISALPPEGLALLELRLRALSPGRPAGPALRPRRRVDGPAPLSFAQERLWFLDQLQPGSPLYNLAGAFRLPGPLHVPALERALREIVRRHEALRTTFASEEGGPVQVIAQEPRLELPVLDLRGRPEEARARAAAEGARPFDLGRGPLLRTTLLRTGEQEHALLLAMHHIVADGWSIGLFFRELAALYEAFAAGRPSPLPELPIQYADFAQWQREWLRGAVLEGLLDYWRRQLAGAPPALELPADRPRPAAQSFEGAARGFSLPPEVSRGIEEIGRQEGATPFMALLAGFQALLHRYSGQETILVGSPVANRNRAEIEGLIGFFVNTLVLRADFPSAAGEPGFRTLVRRTREVTLGAYAHQDLPFEKLVEELRPERNLSHSPLFQVMFMLQNAPTEALEKRSEAPEARLGGSTAKFDLTLQLEAMAEGYAGIVEYGAALFDAPTIVRLIGHLRSLLAAAAADPERPVSELPLLSAGEERQLLVEWRGAETGPLDAVITELLAARAARAPEAMAVELGEASWSCAELDRRSNQVAWRLRRLGVGPETRVGLSAERSLEMVAGLLGILKAGGAWVPLDPAYPEERLDFMRSDAGVALTVTREWLSGIEAEPEGPLASGLEPENLAYLIYTSGSTGRPKGVAVPHRALCNHMLWMLATWPLDAGDAVLQRTPISFDASVWELFAPLLAGARLVLAPPEAHRDAGRLVEVIAARGVTVLQCVPSLLDVLVREPGFRDCRSLRRVYCGGEALTRELEARFLATSGAELYNLYGPTEAAIDSTWWRCGDGGGGPLPIGRPIDNARVHLLDRSLAPAPVGVPGELFVGGRGLARGYHGRPEATAERFLPDPFGDLPGERLYRTGDLARWRSDGAVEYLGRADHQVKIRGYRIEPGEIEAALGAHPGVAEAVVLAREDLPGDRRLVAYVVRTQGPEAGVSELREHLRGRLPEPMVPAVFLFLEALPLAPNGKLDRRALPAPDASRPDLEAAFVEPRTLAERRLAAIWREVLGLERVGVQDDFFELGGHSLLATQVASRVRGAFGADLPLRRIFEAPTVAGLAALLGRGGMAAARSDPGPIRRVSRARPVRASFAQERLWFLDRFHPGSPLYNLSGAFRLPGRLDVPALERALGEIARRHEALRTTFREEEGRPVQVIAERPAAGLRVLDLTGRPEEAEVHVAAETGEPFDLEEGPLLRTLLVRLSPVEHLLALSMHHIVSDGWSMGVFFRELTALYEAFAAGQESPLPELPIQYADFAHWQREWLQGEALEERLAFWRRSLEGAPPLELPADRPRPPAPGFVGAVRWLEIPGTIRESLEELGREEGATPFMVFLSAFQALLHRYTGQESILVGSPIANRNRSEVEGLIGFFANTLVLRGDLSGEPGFRELVRRVREMTLGAYEHQDLPFEKLVEELRPERRLSQNPLFQVMFVLQNAPTGGVAGPEGMPAEERSGPVPAKFDLTLSLSPLERGFAAAVEYSTELFDHATIARWLGHLATLLEGAAGDPDRRVSELPLLPLAERRQVLEEWNATAADFEESTLPELFAAWARRTPEALALEHGETRLSYAELDRRANQVAHRLRRLGVGPEARVGLRLERSPEMVISLLGVLKAGGAYVPLDPSYPEERLDFMRSDAGVERVIAREWLEGIETEPEEPVDSGLLPGNLAYVIYTSGSTGRPKGVLVGHRGLCNMVAEQLRRFGLGPGERVLQFASLSFDISVWDLTLALGAGAALCLGTREELAPGGPLAAFLRERRVTVATLLPSVLATLPEDGLPELRTVIAGAEACPAELADRWAEGRRFYNGYGPTEATVWSTVAPWPGGGRRPPIGRPIGNVRTWVADGFLQPLPVGVPGELLIGGVGLARGYHGRPEATAERFVPDPFGGSPGGRLYRTGDRVRLWPDGNVEFLGRLDQQVKIRGHRIEPGEIEAALREHPGVIEAAVIAREEPSGDRRLVAYVVPRPGTEVGTQELRERLRGQLPEFMVPAAFVLLEALPLMPNGKLDRRALPAPDSRRGLEAACVAPRTPAERRLAAIWCEVLVLERVGVVDDFFELGGHSLLATQVVSRVREAFGVDLPLRRLFEAPTVAELAALLQGEGEGIPWLPMRRVSRARPIRASFAQERLWFLDRFHPGSPLYNLSGAFRLPGLLDVPALERALGEIARRHEALRTTFREEGGYPVQVIAPRLAAGLRVMDLAGRPAEADRLLAAEAAEPFDLERGPLLRTLLVRLSPVDHLLALSMHHIVSDGWSMGVFFRELRALYEAFAAGRESPLPELPIQYADFAHWQREWLQGEVLEEHLAFWRQSLGSAPAALELPADHPRPPAPAFVGAVRWLEIPGEVREPLEELGREEGATPFMVFLSAFQTLLHRYTGQESILVGSPIANRNRSQVEGLIGFFVNTLVLRGDLSGGPGFRELVGRTREMTLGAYEHQDLPFEKLVEELRPERRLSQNPLFQVMFILQNAPTGGVAGPEGMPAGERSGPVPAKFDLTLSLSPLEWGLAAAVEYSTELFDHATIARWLGHLSNLLEAVAGDPDRRVSELPLLSPAERRQVLDEWNATAVPFEASTLPELFAAQARRTPESPALEHGETRLSYAELDRRANQVAHRLRRLGVGPEARVGLRLERSPEMVISLLGVLKAGGAYVPLDPSYPEERLDFMRSDAGVELVIAREWLEGIEAEPEGPVDSGLLPDNLAYVIYTSGSTGRPKGVLVGHRGLCNMVAEQRRLFGLGPGERVLQFASLSFDISVWDLTLALGSGATLCLGTREELAPGEPLAELLYKRRVTAATLLPSVLATLPEDLLPELRTVIAGAEACPAELADRWAEGRRFYNGYGPTEATVWSTVAPWPGGGRRPPIGRPIGNVRIWVADGSLQPLPVGVPGELLIGGVGLARGYHGRPGATAERFVPDPFGGKPGERLYRTGDRVRLWPDGNVEFLGRLDQQVKIRGHRIEPGEIEAALGEHPGVAEAAVVAREEPSGDRRLVAYVVPRPGAEVAAQELREHLRGRLPEPMVPAIVVFLEALPLMPNGKLDRRALPALDASRPTLGAAYLAPRTPAERRLAAIWCEVLDVERVGVHDGFFELGGHSLLATQVVSRVREAFGVDLPLRRLFEAPTVARLAALLEGEGTGIPWLPIRRVSRARPVRASFAQERLWFLDRFHPGSPLYNLAGSFQIPGALDVPSLERALGEIVRRHEALRTTFAEEGGYPVQVIAPRLPAGLRFVDLSGRRAEADRLLAEEAAEPFDLERGPLLRTLLLRLSPLEHVLALSMHHIVSDGWSMGVFFRELRALYEAFAAGQESPLPELPIQYADFAHWQREWLRGEVLEEHLAFWRRSLAGAPAALELPADRPRPAAPGFAGAVQWLEVPGEVRDSLQELGMREGATPFMVLLSAFQALLHRYTGQESILVGSPIANRNRSQIEGLIGFFVNTLVLRGDLSGGPGFRELVGRTREMTLGAYEHQDLPFEKLVEELRPERRLSQNPLFQVMLVLQNAPTAGAVDPGRTSPAPEGITAGTAKFDLLWSAAPLERGFRTALEYSTELFDHATIARWLGHLGILLAGAAEDPDLPVSDLPLLSPAERRQLLEDWNATAAEPAGETLPELFAAQAARTPDAPAVELGEERMTYGELDRRSNQVANRLRRLGVGPESRVGLRLERSPEMVAALLGVLKAGGAYVPLDPSYPEERLAFMRADAGAEPVITREWLEGVEAEPEAPVESGLAPGNLAYLIYTSGSTGKPKGVAMTHSALVNLVLWQLARSAAPGAARTLQFAPLSFDVSFQETLSCLCAGATLVLVREEVRRDFAALWRWIASHGVERVFVPFIALQQLAEAAEELSEIPPCLREVVTAGEQLQAGPAIVRLFERSAGARLINQYGPSETHVATEEPLDGPPCHWPPLPPIGRPIDNVQARVLDRGSRLLPAGVPGELCLGGAALARGYLGRPETTAEKFVPDPYSGAEGGEPGARLYRTGDLARHLPDGRLEFLGRLDHQVKLRGYRIEPGEIETALAAHPGVREAVAMVREDAPGDRRLVAYVVPRPGEEPPATAGLRGFLRERLPEPMVPAAFVILEALPLTPSGKIARALLPAPESVRGGEEGGPTPRSPLEAALAAIWSEVLRAERIGVRESFFDLGGHSLLATQVVSRVRNAFGIDLPLRRLFESPTVAELALAVVLARVEEADRQQVDCVLTEVEGMAAAGRLYE